VRSRDPQPAGIGVIGTTATITSGAYQDAFAAARDTR